MKTVFDSIEIINQNWISAELSCHDFNTELFEVPNLV